MVSTKLSSARISGPLLSLLGILPNPPTYASAPGRSSTFIYGAPVTITGTSILSYKKAFSLIQFSKLPNAKTAISCSSIKLLSSSVIPDVPFPSPLARPIILSFAPYSRKYSDMSHAA